ncbi:hypothetical protein AB4306_18265 [Vibrio splendidus]|uniref:hypothetical protein n=1 Tax=Vibrio splendidus TaxID=29497 RepID=UPI000AC976CF|nr:hypothetical protein [Vibrio splendidus]PHX05515.1 hypothetical protein VSPL_29090 [Vibrio splendidus]
MKKFPPILLLTYLLFGCSIHNSNTDGQNEHQDEPDGSGGVVFSETIDARPVVVSNLTR